MFECACMWEEDTEDVVSFCSKMHGILNASYEHVLDHMAVTFQHATTWTSNKSRLPSSKSYNAPQYGECKCSILSCVGATSQRQWNGQGSLWWAVTGRPWRRCAGPTQALHTSCCVRGWQRLHWIECFFNGFCRADTWTSVCIFLWLPPIRLCFKRLLLAACITIGERDHLFLHMSQRQESIMMWLYSVMNTEYCVRMCECFLVGMRPCVEYWH